VKLRGRQALAVAALLPCLGGAICGDIYVDYTQRTLVVDDVSAIDLDIDRGSAEVFAFDRNGVVLSKYVSSFADSVESGFEIDGDRLEILGDCTNDRKCAVSWYAEIPFGTAVSAAIPNGPLKISGVDAPIDVEVGEGFEGALLRAPELDVVVDEGDVTIELIAAPERVAIEVGEGEVDLAVPAGTYRCELSSADGEITTEDIVCEDAATSTLTVAIVVAGNIHLRPST
jgi:hypothetical protein